MVQVAAMFALPLLALSLAIPPKRSTSALGVFLSLVIIVTYHKINEYAEQMGVLGRINPWLALWVPYVFFCAFSYLMFNMLAKQGGKPTGPRHHGSPTFSSRPITLLHGPT